MTLEERFFSKVQKTDACWIWIGRINKGGYGEFDSYQTRLAHRAMWELFHEEQIPPGMCILHHCDNPKCVNPRHLFLGTHQDNVADKTKKGRAAKGEANGNVKLSVQEVLDIRAAPGKYRDIAQQYGICYTNVGKIKRREKWKHL